mgnify:CR=1 FL=1
MGGQEEVGIVDPQAKWTVQPRAWISKAKSKPFNGMQWQGKVSTTLGDGAVVVSR